MTTIREAALLEIGDELRPSLLAKTDQLRAKLRADLGDLPSEVFEPLMQSLRAKRFPKACREMPIGLLAMVGALAAVMLVELYEELLAEIEAEEAAK